MSTASTWFITGTDTNAGKTQLARALLLAARARGLHGVGYKPIESGCPPNQVGLDAQALAVAAASGPETSYVFEAPVAPWQAAQITGETISISRLKNRAMALQQDCEILIVEGAGGLLVPLTESETIADLAAAIAAPILIVAPDCLGTINHSLLTIAAIRTRGLAVAALILNERDRGAGQGLGNESQIRQHAQVRVLQLPYAENDQELALAGGTILSALLADAES